MFRKFDINKDGVIDFGEFKNGMLKWNMNLDDEELHELFDRYDQGGKGHVSYYEFIKPKPFELPDKRWIVGRESVRFQEG